MRAIRFRGFSKKHQQWLTGNYILNRGAHFIAPVDEPADGKTWEDYEVNPDTVGQYICHMNDCDFYEGDIVEDSFGDRFSIEWDERDAQFYLYDPVGKVREPWDDHYLTVIGNIHEHHELCDSARADESSLSVCRA